MKKTAREMKRYAKFAVEFGELCQKYGYDRGIALAESTQWYDVVRYPLSTLEGVERVKESKRIIARAASMLAMFSTEADDSEAFVSTIDIRRLAED